jgi:hypothetical protein
VYNIHTFPYEYFYLAPDDGFYTGRNMLHETTVKYCQNHSYGGRSFCIRLKVKQMALKVGSVSTKLHLVLVVTYKAELQIIPISPCPIYQKHFLSDGSYFSLTYHF